ncbi:MAG: AraC family transcriptional regulator [Abyssibacter sp.]|jgi:AraC-like DNA-binding protein|nr:AraC family transcriptional regulator [Abyssibacter sp.]MCK5860092.1 AraC family transcriptional regulator [Abyssibacter sp.]
MPAWNFDRAVTSMRLMTELALERGVPPATVLAGTQVSADQLNNPDVVVGAQQELRLIANLVDALGDEQALGIDAGRRYHFTAFGALGFAMVSSQTMREAMTIGLRYFHLTFAFTQFAVSDQGAQTRLRLDDGELPPALRRFIVERDSAAFITLQRDIFGPQPVIDALSFRYPAPRQAAAAYQAFYGLAPQFDAVANEALLDRAALERRLPQANDLARQAAETQCRSILDARAPRSGLAGRVRERIAARLAERATMAEIAGGLHMIPRTLRRRLQEEGTTYAELRDEVRQALADEYLAGPRLSIDQIANRLGYAESTSFINAFRRWHGVTPHAYRLSHRV